MCSFVNKTVPKNAQKSFILFYNLIPFHIDMAANRRINAVIKSFGSKGVARERNKTFNLQVTFIEHTISAEYWSLKEKFLERPVNLS